MSELLFEMENRDMNSILASELAGYIPLKHDAHTTIVYRTRIELPLVVMSTIQGLQPHAPPYSISYWEYMMGPP
jgi:hypothetical protein